MRLPSRAVVGLIVLAALHSAVAATYTVTNTTDAAVGSLRWAIQQANASIGIPDTINFNIAGAGVHTISVLTPLPQITDQAGVLIDGLSQPGASAGANPPATAVLMIQLDGSLLPVPVPPPPNSESHGLWVRSSNNTIQGLIVNNFPHDGICIQASLPGADNNRVYCNFSGTDPTGGVPIQNGRDSGSGLWAGIYVNLVPGSPGFALNNIIEHNLASGNFAEGIGISSCPNDGDVAWNIVRYNRVGTDLNGLFPLGNIHDGVYIGEGAHNNTVHDNLIAANGFEGVSVVGWAEGGFYTDSNAVIHNLIGLDVNMLPLGNSLHGVSIGAYGTNYWGGFARHNVVGTNRIAWNHRNGVMVWEHATNSINADHNWITQNSIYSNGYHDPGYLGIDLQADGLTYNDYSPDDLDTGPNEFVNFPQITGASYSLGYATIWGTLQLDTAESSATVELFRARPDSTGKNHGQGDLYLGSVTPDAAGNWTTVVFGVVYPTNWVTATATDVNRNTSEFAENVRVSGDPNWDFGDAPDTPYPTLLAQDGARHTVNSGIYLGSLIDTESDGQQNASATGDDTAGQADEDGAFFPFPLIPGQQSAADIVASTNGLVDAWIDFDVNGAWDATEQIFASQPVTSGSNRLFFAVSGGALADTGTFARVRYSTVGALSPTGPAPDGEVEDQTVHIDPEGSIDFGDAPDGPYPTVLANNGAWHVTSALYLGATVDGEYDGQPEPSALGDDNAGDDEDGVTFRSPIVQGQTAAVAVIASQAGVLDGWLDFGADGSWANAGDQIFNGASVSSGSNSLSFLVPTNSTTGATFSRFRLSGAGCASYAGFCSGGEVEDYMINIRTAMQVAVAWDGTNMNLSWNPVPGTTGYDVHASPIVSNAFPSAWTNLTQPSTTGTTWQVTPGAVTARFYRVRGLW